MRCQMFQSPDVGLCGQILEIARSMVTERRARDPSFRQKRDRVH
jgi:hypothetical protein